MKKIKLMLLLSILGISTLCAGSVQNVKAETVDIKIDETNFPDDIFRSYVSEKLDSDNDDILSQEEINNVTEIYCGVDTRTVEVKPRKPIS